MNVKNSRGDLLGTVDSLIDTGVNDVIVIKNNKETLLLAYKHGVTVLRVNPDENIITIDEAYIVFNEAK